MKCRSELVNSRQALLMIKHSTFLRDYTKDLRDGNAALFIGAGVSRAAGFVNWKELLREIADDLDLDIDRETDLIALAQYHVNSSQGRHKINQKLIDEFLEDAVLTPAHEQIALLPIHTVWTTNYDDLLERSFVARQKRVDVKRVSEDFAHSQRRADVTIYNMHGDRTNPSTAVLTKEDFESYNETRELFTVALKGDLTQKTFLFIGISFDDPNVMDILSRVKQLLAGNSREHYCLLKPPTDDGTPDGAYRVKRFSHWLKDLQRYHVQPVLIDDFNEIPTILAELNRRSHLRDVFISGSAADFSPLGEARFKELCHRLGSALIEKNFNIISGFGLGVGDMVISGAMQALGRNRDDRLQLWPFPQTVTGDRAAFWRDYRTRMISEAGVCIVLSGNKQDGSVIVPANGVREEIEIAQSLGKSVIPIGATGFVALEHWQNLKVNSAPYLGSANCSEAMDVLGNSASTTEQLVNALLDVLKTLDK